LKNSFYEKFGFLGLMNSQELFMKELLKEEENQLLAEINDKIMEKKTLLMIPSDNELLR